MFSIVRDDAKFAAEVIPQYCDHSKFASLLQQLSGFRKVQPNAVRKADFDESTTNHKLFMNGSLKRDAKELILKFKSLQKQEHRVTHLEGKVMSITTKMKVLEDTNSLLENKLVILEQHLKLDLSQHARSMEDKVELEQSSPVKKSRASSPSSAVLEQRSHNIHFSRKKTADDCNSLQTHNAAFPNLIQASLPTIPSHAPSASSLNEAEVLSRESEPSYVCISELSSEPSSLPTLPKITDVKLNVRQDKVDVQVQKRTVESHTSTQNKPPPSNQTPLSATTNEIDDFLDLDASFSLSEASSEVNTQTWDLV